MVIIYDYYLSLKEFNWDLSVFTGDFRIIYYQSNNLEKCEMRLNVQGCD